MDGHVTSVGRALQQRLQSQWGQRRSGEEETGSEAGVESTNHVDGLEPKRRDQHGITIAAFIKERDNGGGNEVVGVEIRFGSIVLDLDVDLHPDASVECFRQRGDKRRKLRLDRSNNRSHSSHGGVVVNNERVVGRSPHVEFNHGRPLKLRFNERAEGIFATRLRRAAVGDDQGHFDHQRRP